MPFIKDICRYGSLSVVGLEKNTGKTESLNYILSRLSSMDKTIALTSIGTDGEGIDQVTHTAKPEITLSPGMLFATAEQHYHQRLLTSEILDISNRRTSLGRLVLARAVTEGKVLLSGPAETVWIKSLIRQFKEEYYASLTLVDGALSRLSLASPNITESMILATGAALSANIPELVRQTTFICQLISLPEIMDSKLCNELLSINNGVWAINNESEPVDLGIASAFTIGSHTEGLFEHGTRLFVAGAVGDKLMNHLRVQKNAEDIELIVKDFTKLFIAPTSYNAFLKSGARLTVLEKPNLLAITVNPVSPNGRVLDSSELIEALRERINLPIYNVRELARE